MGAPRWRDNLDRGLKRYEPVLIVLCLVVLLARYGPGGGGGAMGTGPIAAPFVPAAGPPTSMSTVPPAAAPNVPVAPPRPFAGSTAPALRPPAPSSSAGRAPTAVAAGATSYAILSSDVTPGGMTSTDDGVALVGLTLADGTAQVLSYEGAGSLARTYELGEITGRIADLEMVDQGVLYIVGADPARVVALRLETGQERVIADLPDVPPCLPVAVTTNCDASVIDRTPLATGITVDEDGNTYVADANQGALWRVDAGTEEAYQVIVSEDLAGPIGPEGGLGVQDVGIASGGHLALTVARVGDGPGAVLLQEITADGRPGARAVLYEADAEEHLGPLLVSAAGRILIGIGGAGQVALLEPDGSVVTRLPAEGALGTPKGVAFDGTAVLVSTQGATNEIVRLETGEVRASRR